MNDHNDNSKLVKAMPELSYQESPLPYGDPVAPGTGGADLNKDLLAAHYAMGDVGVQPLPDPYPDIPEVYYG